MTQVEVLPRGTRDNGDEEVLDRLFMPFYKRPKTSQKK